MVKSGRSIPGVSPSEVAGGGAIRARRLCIRFNLGIYELLKRGCRVVVAADAEADPAMNFTSLVRLERCSRIDLGVRIDLPWKRLRSWSLGITEQSPHDPGGDPSTCNGPHVALGRID